MAELQAVLDVRKFSTDALSGSALQNGKQGIALVHGRRGPFPDGRIIGTQSLSNIIWQSRNQALHWEDGSFTPPVNDCFEALANDIDPKFRDFKTRNMSSDVVTLLGWKEFADFERDMLLLS